MDTRIARLVLKKVLKQLRVYLQVFAYLIAPFWAKIIIKKIRFVDNVILHAKLARIAKTIIALNVLMG